MQTRFAVRPAAARASADLRLAPVRLSLPIALARVVIAGLPLVLLRSNARVHGSIHLILLAIFSPVLYAIAELMTVSALVHRVSGAIALRAIVPAAFRQRGVLRLLRGLWLRFLGVGLLAMLVVLSVLFTVAFANGSIDAPQASKLSRNSLAGLSFGAGWVVLWYGWLSRFKLSVPLFVLTAGEGDLVKLSALLTLGRRALFAAISLAELVTTALPLVWLAHHLNMRFGAAYPWVIAGRLTALVALSPVTTWFLLLCTELAVQALAQRAAEHRPPAASVTQPA